MDVLETFKRTTFSHETQTLFKKRIACLVTFSKTSLSQLICLFSEGEVHFEEIRLVVVQSLLLVFNEGHHFPKRDSTVHINQIQHHCFYFLWQEGYIVLEELEGYRFDYLDQSLALAIGNYVVILFCWVLEPRFCPLPTIVRACQSHQRR